MWSTQVTVSGHLLVPCGVVQVGLHLQSCVHFLHWLRVFPPPSPVVSVAGHEDAPFCAVRAARDFEEPFPSPCSVATVALVLPSTMTFSYHSLVRTETAHMWSFRESYSVGLPGLVGYLDCIE